MIRKGMKAPNSRRIPFLLIIFCLLLLPFEKLQAADSPRVKSLIERAQSLGLAEDPYWLTLLHYKKGWTGSRSLVDDPGFFLSPEGKRNPAAEMEEMLRAVFLPVENETKHAACRFIARFEWLKEKLDIDPATLPMAECPRFNKMAGEIQPESVSLIFPAAHINSPASMFGHTLLTIDTAHKSRLLAYAINYTAVTTDTFGPLFAVKGIFGFYPGYFSMMPYYEKLQEYSDIEQRDIWEYRLNLQEGEILRLLRHAYEMDQIYADYYFFDENCSYTLLFLLDVARPGLQLTDQCSPWVIPLDTVRIVQDNGLVTAATFRPSRAGKVRHLASLLPEPERVTARDAALGSTPPSRILGLDIPREGKIIMTDLAGEYLQYRYTKKDIPNDIFNERFLEILKTRSLLGATLKIGQEVPEPPRPDKGHLSNRFSFGGGIREGDSFGELRIRPAYHELSDSDEGYVEGSQIIFTGVGFRYYFESERFKLQSLDLIDIISISPRDDFFSPLSWKVRTGLSQKLGTDGSDHLVYDLTAGGGLSWKSSLAGLFYVFAEAEADLSEQSGEHWAAGAGGSAGLIRSIGSSWKIHFSGRDLYYALGNGHNFLTLSFQTDYSLTADSSISANVRWTKVSGISDAEGTLSGNIYF